MRTNLSKFRKIAVLTIFLATFGSAVRATIFTAVLSGNFNSSLTWGGVVPGGLLTTDIVIIPSGITVDLTTSEVLSGTATLSVDGVLTSSTTGGSLVLTSGSLSGMGTISVDSLTLGLTSGFTFTGNIKVPKLTSLGANLSAAANTTVSNTLKLTSGILSLTSGNLTMGNGSTISISGGTVTTGGTGVIHLDSVYSVLYTATSVATGAELTGSGLDNITVNVPGTVTLSSNQTVNGLLTLTSGALALNGYSLTFGAMGDLSSAVGGTISGSGLSNIIVNTTGSLTGALNFTTGANVLHNLTLNTGMANAVVKLGSDLLVNGVLTLTSGVLALNDHALTLGATGDLVSTVNGTIKGTSLSDLIVNTAGSLTGNLNFDATGNMLNNLTVNMGSLSDVINLGSNLNIDGTLSLVTGKIKLAANDLKVAAGGLISGGSSTSYVITNGAGHLVMNLAAGATDKFDVGSLTDYLPISITANPGSTTGDVSLNVINGVYAAGTSGALLSSTQSVVNGTWFVSSTATGINYTMTAMWSAALELNGFDRTHAFISHYTGGAWDLNTTTTAGVSGSMYTMTRTGITSLSPFMVADNHALTTYVPNISVAANDILLYPNPATNNLYFSTTASINNIEVYDLTGRQFIAADGGRNYLPVENLPEGVYFIRFTGKDLNTVKRFVKE